MDPMQGLQAVVILIGTGVASYAAIALIQAITRRIGGGSTPVISSELHAELQDLRARIEDGEQARGRIAELEERLDFAERLLTQQRESSQLMKGEGG